jgi:hypothetical protein
MEDCLSTIGLPKHRQRRHGIAPLQAFGTQMGRLKK